MHAFPGAIEYYIKVVQDSQRYGIIEEEFRSIFAFFPVVLEPTSCGDYLDDYWTFDSEEVQNEIFAADRVDCMSEEDRQSLQLSHLFVADIEAMRTGFVRWVVTDQYGSLLFGERIQPWSLMDLQGLISEGNCSLQQFRDRVARGCYGNGPRYRSNGVVGPWNPPTDESEVDCEWVFI